MNRANNAAKCASHPLQHVITLHGLFTGMEKNLIVSPSIVKSTAADDAVAFGEILRKRRRVL